MLKQFYNSIIERLNSITVASPSGGDPKPLFAQTGYWNEQWAYEAQNSPLRFPCCFVEFASMPMESIGNKVQQSTAIVKIHLGSRSLNEDDISHFDIIEAVNYWISGFQGTGFSTFTRTAIEIDHNHDALVTHSITYRVRIQDDTAKRPLLRVDGDLLVIERFID